MLLASASRYCRGRGKETDVIQSVNQHLRCPYWLNNESNECVKLIQAIFLNTFMKIFLSTLEVNFLWS